MKAMSKRLFTEKHSIKAIISSLNDQIKLALIDQVNHYYKVLILANDIR